MRVCSSLPKARTAFDRVLPEWAPQVSSNGVPYAALALMLIAITFLGTVAATILPWRRPDTCNASPIAKYRILGLPIITVAAILFA